MKKFLILLVAALAILSVQSARAEVSLSFFYDSLQDDGDWFEADDYGYCWQPRDVSADWSPYTDGYWTYTDAGWTWVSYESHGWATYHYGRWADIRGRGWVWVPGYEWGPAWVSWRSNDDYVGWAPLPARAALSVGVTIGRDVDYDYDIGPSYYRFTSCQRFGSPSLRQVIVDRSQNVTIINQTTNITNISYRGDYVYNGGPDYDRINRRSDRKIERLQLDRVTRIDNQRDYRYTRRENGRLSVVAPPVVPVGERQRPRNIKASLGKVQTENGWSGVRDAKLAQRTRDKIRDENKGRNRGPVNRNESVAQALRSEARQKQVAVAPAQQVNLRSQKRPGVNDREAKPIGKGPLKLTDPAPHTPSKGPVAKVQAPNNGVRPEKPGNAERRNEIAPEPQKPRNLAPAKSNNKEDQQKQAAARRRDVVEKENAVRQQAVRQEASQQAARQQANAQKEQQASRQRNLANTARQQEDAAARQQAARRGNAEQAQANRARAQREAAAQAPARRPAQVQPQQQRPKAQQPRPQVKPNNAKQPAPVPTEARSGKKKKDKDDEDNR